MTDTVQTFEVHTPAAPAVIAELCDGTAADATAAVDAAARLPRLVCRAHFASRRHSTSACRRKPGCRFDPAAPFNGLKQGGRGREGAREGIREHQEMQYFSIDLST